MSASNQTIPAKRPTRVLLAEGDQISLTHLRLLLGKIGYDVEVASDGMEALQRLQSSNPPGLAVLDWTMPGLNGTDVCRSLQSAPRRKSTYVVLLTDWKQQKDRVDALEAGADDCVYKPVDVRELRVRLQLGSQLILEHALRESEERLRGAFEYSGTGMALAQINGEFLQVNPALSEFLGYTQEELMVMGAHAIGHPDNRPRSEELLEQFLKSGRRSQEFERKFLTKPGSVAWVLITLSTVLDSDQHATCFFVQFNDITQRKAAEAALQRSEALFRAITTNANDLIMVRDLDYTCRYASPSYTQYLGYTQEELLGGEMQSLVHPQDQVLIEAAVTQVRRDQKPRVLTLRYRSKDGRWLHVESNISPLRQPDGNLNGLMVVSRTVEDRIQAERKLQAAYAETELFLQSIPSILIGLDGVGRITRWNPMAADCLGLASAQVMGQKIDNCGIQWSPAEISLELARWLQSETASRSELRFERDGQMHFLGVHVRHIPTLEGESKRLLLTGADVTGRKLLEDQLRQAQKLEAIGQLAAGVAHEINTPTQYVGDNTRFLKDSWSSLAGLLEFGRTLRHEARGGVISPELLAQYDHLAEQADLDYLLKEIPAAITQSLDGVQRVAKIVQGMKEFSHPGSEDKRAIDINRAIETTITVTRHEWKYVADVVTHFDPVLPLIPCLIGEFNQVILNLIINAAQAIAPTVEAGTVKRGTITITTSREDQWAKIAVQDTGGGIPQEIRARIFEPFFTTKAVGKGTGQGLTLAHSAIVSRHQGQIWFETETGKGTTFFIRLPMAAAPQPS